MSGAKSKQIAVRLSPEDYLAVRNEALRKGLEMGPMVDAWIRPRIERIKASGSPSSVPAVLPAGG